MSTVGLYAYDGALLPVEVVHRAGREHTLCGLSLMGTMRVTEYRPIQGDDCAECAQAAREGDRRILDLLRNHGTTPPNEGARA